jgi:hypothetical protein
MKNDQFLLETLNQNTQLLLDCGDNAGLMKLAVDKIYKIYSHITGVKIDQLNVDKDILLPSGKAISTAAAAHCLLEMKRTAVFLRGINKAINQKLTQAAGKSIRILYAGREKSLQLSAVSYSKGLYKILLTFKNNHYV